MTMTNSERQCKHYLLHRMKGFGGQRAKKELTMRRIFNYLYKHGNTRASALYQTLHAERDQATWRWLMGEIHHNFMNDDKLAPVTQRGTGRSGDAVYLQLSDQWEQERDWDKEQAEKAARVLNVVDPFADPTPINPLDIEPF
jgi:hypothetical protein